MKTLLFGILTLLLVQIVYAQTKAVTEYGDTIYVYNNGTWSYELQDEMPDLLNELSYLNTTINIDTLESVFSTPKSSTKVLKNVRNQFTIKYDETYWKRVPPATLNEDAEFALQGKKSDVWCIVIAEETPIQADKLFLIARQTMEESTGTTVKILKTEHRIVNGTPVIRGTLEASFSGINFIFDSYYFSNEHGSVQFTTWTSDILWEKNQEMILQLLNGFEVNK